MEEVVHCLYTQYKCMTLMSYTCSYDYLYYLGKNCNNKIGFVSNFNLHPVSSFPDQVTLVSLTYTYNMLGTKFT